MKNAIHCNTAVPIGLARGFFKFPGFPGMRMNSFRNQSSWSVTARYFFSRQLPNASNQGIVAGFCLSQYAFDWSILRQQKSIMAIIVVSEWRILESIWWICNHICRNLQPWWSWITVNDKNVCFKFIVFNIKGVVWPDITRYKKYLIFLELHLYQAEYEKQNSLVSRSF